MMFLHHIITLLPNIIKGVSSHKLCSNNHKIKNIVSYKVSQWNRKSSDNGFYTKCLQAVPQYHACIFQKQKSFCAALSVEFTSHYREIDWMFIVKSIVNEWTSKWFHRHQKYPVNGRGQSVSIDDEISARSPLSPHCWNNNHSNNNGKAKERCNEMMKEAERIGRHVLITGRHVISPCWQSHWDFQMIRNKTTTETI